MTRSETYQLLVSRDPDGAVSELALEATDVDSQRRAIRVNGARAIQVTGPLHDLLRAEKIPGRSWAGSAPIQLPPVLGAQVELMLRAAKPLRRHDRIADVAEGVAGMSREEASYWHAQSSHRAGLRALRILLSAGDHR